VNKEWKEFFEDQQNLKLITKEYDSFMTGAVGSAILATAELLVIGDASHSTKAVAKLHSTNRKSGMAD